MAQMLKIFSGFILELWHRSSLLRVHRIRWTILTWWVIRDECHTHTHIHSGKTRMCVFDVYMYIHIYARIRTYIHICTYIYTYTYAYIHMYTYVYEYICIRVYMCAYICILKVWSLYLHILSCFLQVINSCCLINVPVIVSTSY